MMRYVLGIVGWMLLSQAVVAKTTLHFWYFSGKPAFIQKIEHDFEARHPDVDLVVQQLTWDNGFDKIAISFAAQNEPDVCELGNTWVVKFASADVLADLTTSFAQQKDQYLLWQPNIYRGKIYGVPWLLGSRVLFYNKDLFRRAGLDPEKPPQTWTELLEASRRIAGLGKGYYGFGISAAEAYTPWQNFLPFAWGNGAHVLTQDLKRAAITSPAFKEALSFYMTLLPYAYINRSTQLAEAFTVKERLGMFISGAWNLNIIPHKNPSLHYGVALVPKPDHGGTHASFAGGESLIVSKRSKHPQLATALVKMLVSEPYLREVIHYERSVFPSLKRLRDDPYYDQYPRQKVFYDQLFYAQAPPPHPRWVDIQDVLTMMLDKVVYQKLSVKAALAETEKKINAILDEASKMGDVTDARLNRWIISGIALLLVLGIVGSYVDLRKRKLGFRDVGIWYLFLSPWILTFVVFTMYPLLYSMVLGFMRYNLISGAGAFVGWNNFISTLQNPAFWSAVGHTVFFAIGTIPFTIVFALLSAVLIYSFPWKNFFQGALFLPTVTSIVVIATIFMYIYADTGILNLMLQKLGITPPQPSWLLNTKLALPAIMAMAVWSSFGYYTVLFLAGLKQIPKGLYEASAIDGANKFQQFIYIILPQLRPIMLFVVVINTIRSLQVFPEIFTMTKGGPLGSTTTIVYHLYEKGFHQFRMGEASAIAYLLFLMIILFTAFQAKVLKEE